MKLSTLHDMMREFNARVAHGSECEALGAFVDDCYVTYGMAPWEVDAQLQEVSESFADYWSMVSRCDIDGATTDYDARGALRD